eukprot:scaffold69765_cov32-Phaeocystis_antarctica.AAC.1
MDDTCSGATESPHGGKAYSPAVPLSDLDKGSLAASNEQRLHVRHVNRLNSDCRAAEAGRASPRLRSTSCGTKLCAPIHSVRNAASNTEHTLSTCDRWEIPCYRRSAAPSEPVRPSRRRPSGGPPADRAALARAVPGSPSRPPPELPPEQQPALSIHSGGSCASCRRPSRRHPRQPPPESCRLTIGISHGDMISRNLGGFPL